MEKLSYSDWNLTNPLHKEQKVREQVVEKRAREDVRPSELFEFSKLVKKADEETREVLLQPGVTMEDARRTVKQEEMEEAVEEKTAEEEVSEEERRKWKEKVGEAEEKREEILPKSQCSERKVGEVRRVCRLVM